MGATWRGEAAYGLYRLLTSALSPLFLLHLHGRRLGRLEHPVRWPVRFGRPSSPRPPGPLLWFHAVSLGEGVAAISVIKRCLQELPSFTVLMTTTTVSAFEVIKDKLPNCVIYQFAPIDTPAVMDAFFQYWDPQAVFLIESELWPNLILCASRREIAIALLNARISLKSFTRWCTPPVVPLISLMLSKFSLIAPLSTVEGIRYQLLQAPPSSIHFAGDLKCEGIEYVQRSLHQKMTSSTSIYIIDTLGQLRSLYRLVPIAVVGGSFLRGFKGHNISEAAAAGCAVLTRPYVGHFSQLISKMKQLNPLSIQQVSGKLELLEILRFLLSDVEALGARRNAAKQAFLALSSGVVDRLWKLIDIHVLKRNLR